MGTHYVLPAWITLIFSKQKVPTFYFNTELDSIGGENSNVRPRRRGETLRQGPPALTTAISKTRIPHQRVVGPGACLSLSPVSLTSSRAQSVDMDMELALHSIPF